MGQIQLISTTNSVVIRFKTINFVFKRANPPGQGRTKKMIYRLQFEIIFISLLNIYFEVLEVTIIRQRKKYTVFSRGYQQFFIKNVKNAVACFRIGNSFTCLIIDRLGFTRALYSPDNGLSVDIHQDSV